MPNDGPKGQISNQGRGGHFTPVTLYNGLEARPGREVTSEALVWVSCRQIPSALAAALCPVLSPLHHS